MALILAGVDEAGLGPVLGPLATASAALKVPDDWRPDSPWERLAPAVLRAWRRGQRAATVSDSKVLYKTGGLAAMELTLGALGWFRDGLGAPVIVVRDDPGCETIHPCYSRRPQSFPTHATPEDMAFVTEQVADACARAGSGPAHLEAALLFEPPLNRRFADGLNKNQALLVETGRHVRRLADRFPDSRLVVVVDKQGGRNDYLPFLSDLFPGFWLDEIEAGAACSRYLVRRDGGDIDIAFRAKGDRDSFVTALASLAAKYARERAMAELNDWFRQRVPDLKPTAGYPTDARRWLDDVGGRDDLEVKKIVRER